MITGVSCLKDYVFSLGGEGAGRKLTLTGQLFGVRLIDTFPAFVL